MMSRIEISKSTHLHILMLIQVVQHICFLEPQQKATTNRNSEENTKIVNAPNYGL